MCSWLCSCKSMFVVQYPLGAYSSAVHAVLTQVCSTLVCCPCWALGWSWGVKSRLGDHEAAAAAAEGSHRSFFNYLLQSWESTAEGYPSQMLLAASREVPSKDAKVRWHVACHTCNFWMGSGLLVNGHWSRVACAVVLASSCVLLYTEDEQHFRIRFRLAKLQWH